MKKKIIFIKHRWKVNFQIVSDVRSSTGPKTVSIVPQNRPFNTAVKYNDILFHHNSQASLCILFSSVRLGATSCPPAAHGGPWGKRHPHHSLWNIPCWNSLRCCSLWPHGGSKLKQEPVWTCEPMEGDPHLLLKTWPGT